MNPPLSPYLFILGMEVLSRILQKRVQESGSFSFYPYCGRNLTQLTFANDLLTFSATIVDSVKLIKSSLEELESYSSLKANPSKSEMFCIAIQDEIKHQILARY